MMCLVLCNIRTPAMRKHAIVEEVSSIASGLLVLLLLYALTWSFSPVAYINFPGKEFPDFYPVFQVMNSFTGIFLFICLGIGSKRFRAVMTGRAGKKVRCMLCVNNSKKNSQNSLFSFCSSPSNS